MSVRSASSYAVFNISWSSYINNYIYINYNVNWKWKKYFPHIFIKVSYGSDESDEYSTWYITNRGSLRFEIDNKNFKKNNSIIIKPIFFISKILRKEWVHLTKKDYNFIRKKIKLAIVSDSCNYQETDDLINVFFINNVNFNNKEIKGDNIVIDENNNIYINKIDNKGNEKRILIKFITIYAFMKNVYKTVNDDLQDVEFL